MAFDPYREKQQLIAKPLFSKTLCSCEDAYISVTRHVPALVVGGGISGLVCAYALRKAGIDAQLAEASPRPGGVIRSITRDGFLLELGPQSFSGTLALRELCTELGISDELLQAPPRAPRYVLIDGQFRPVPLSPPAFFTSSLLSASTKWAIVRDILRISIPPDADQSVAAFVRRKFSAQLLDRLVGPIVSGIYAGDPERLSVRSAFPQLYAAEMAAGGIVRAMLRLAKSRKGPRERPTLLTFRQGNETLVRALANKLAPAPPTATSPTAISRQQDGSFAIRLQSDGRDESVSAGSVILATPPDIARKLLAKLDSSIDSLLSPF